MIDYVIFFMLATICGAIATWIIRYWALKKGIVNKPNPIIPQHTKPIAYLGGAGVFGGIVLAAICSYFFQNHSFAILAATFSANAAIVIGAALYLGWGIYDDIKQLEPLKKFVGQLVIAIVAVSLGIKTEFFQIPYLDLDFIFSVFWVLVIVNALNFTDVCDGLVGGICMITFLTAGILRPEFGIFCFLIFGATMGFLFFNLPRASIFLGDAGSHLLGFLIAVVGIEGSVELRIMDAAVWMLFLSSVPLFELIFLTAIRVYRGMPWWRGSPDHFSLRLQQAGLTRWQIDILAGVLSALIVSFACMYASLQLWLKYILITFTFLLYAVIWRMLLRWEVKRK